MLSDEGRLNNLEARVDNVSKSGMRVIIQVLGHVISIVTSQVMSSRVKQRKTRVRDIRKSLEKTQYLMNTLYINEEKKHTKTQKEIKTKKKICKILCCFNVLMLENNRYQMPRQTQDDDRGR